MSLTKCFFFLLMYHLNKKIGNFSSHIKKDSHPSSDKKQNNKIFSGAKPSRFRSTKQIAKNWYPILNRNKAPKVSQMPVIWHFLCALVMIYCEKLSSRFQLSHFDEGLWPTFFSHCKKGRSERKCGNDITLD